MDMNRPTPAQPRRLKLKDRARPLHFIVKGLHGCSQRSGSRGFGDFGGFRGLGFRALGFWGLGFRGVGFRV